MLYKIKHNYNPKLITDKSYYTPPKSGSDAKKPDKLSDWNKEIEEAIEKVLKMELATRLLGFEE